MIRKIITIDAEKCTGCGLCAEACHEGAIVMRNGKAELPRDEYCDGLGDCLPACPTGAISFEEREALPYDEEAVLQNMRAKDTPPRGCPGSMARSLSPLAAPSSTKPGSAKSHLAQWPVQMQLVPVTAPFFNGAGILFAAHCSAFACASFHEDFMRGKVTVIACPKLDAFDHTAKLAEILTRNDIRSLTVARMSVPCCGGLERIAQNALGASCKDIPLKTIIIGTDGSV